MKIKMTPEEEKSNKLYQGTQLQLDIFILEAGELLIKANSAFLRKNDPDFRLKTYTEYLEWYTRVYNFFADTSNFDYLTRWAAIKSFQPKKYPKFNMQPDKEGAEIRDKIINDLNELKSIIKDEKIILEEMKETFTEKTAIQGKPNDIKKSLKSIHLVSKSIVANDVIFLVLDEQWQMPIRFSVWNAGGAESAIKKLHSLAYPAPEAPNKRVDYSKRLADNINNGIFKNAKIKEYMKTNKLDKPTLVQKAKDEILVLKNEIPVVDITFEKVPTQHRFQYIDKTK